MTFSRGFSIATVVAILAAMAWIYYQRETTRRLILEVNVLIDEAVRLSTITAEKSALLGELTSSDAAVRSNRPKIDAASREALDASQTTAKLYRAAAEITGAVIDRAKVDVDRRVWRMRRDSLLKLAEAAEAATDGFAVWSDPNVTLQAAHDRIVDSGNRAAELREQADQLKGDARALELASRR